MGYESKIYIGEVRGNDFFDVDGFNWMSVVAMMDMCKMGYRCHLDEVFQQYKNLYLSNHTAVRKIYVFGTDGDTKIKVDCYGEVLLAVPLDKCVDAVGEDSKDDDYWRFKVLHDLLYSIKLYYSGKEMFVSRYGY